jgi:hypothetical protein
MVELLSILALATKQVIQGRSSELSTLMRSLTQFHVAAFVKKLFGGNRVKAILQRLDRLTQDEARMTTVEILKVVHGLVQSVNVGMDGKETHAPYCTLSVERSSL